MSEEDPHQSTPAETVIDQPAFRVALSNQNSDEFVDTAAQVISSRLNAHTDVHESDAQALEGHEVIELQAFSERKTWIEEKIKFLEQLPPIEVFVGLDAVRSSAKEIPGLPTREQLNQWLVEHDKIEKETEIFDSGELKKLKKFTKAATQRTLSPQDTDLIELTLITIYELDKLFHLLRDRSDNLELLSVRLTWEERRIGAWDELQKILTDLREFLNTRARWSPAVYDSVNLLSVEEDSGRRRRNSVASMVSVASESSYAPTPAFSRSARFQLSESLSRDAAQFASRISSLRHTKIAGAGKALDKLIDHSRKPVPEELLDEQDKLENEGINELEDMGKFIMHVIMQWKKADEIYVETLKDEADAQNLLEEMEVAKLHHPTPRQDSSFLARTNALSKRLLFRGNPASPSSSFPQPLHPLFPDQQKSNDDIIRILTAALASASDQVKKAEGQAKDYHTVYEAVKRVDGICKASSELMAQFDSLIDRFSTGVSTTSGDGTPPVDCTDACLQTSEHSVFLALLPSLSEELKKAEKESIELEKTAGIALMDLDYPAVDEQFKLESAEEIDQLSNRRDVAVTVGAKTVTRASVLGKARELWSTMTQIFEEVEEKRGEVIENMERQMWKQQFRPHDLPPTPESPATAIPSAVTSTFAMQEQLDSLQARIDQTISTPLSSLPQTPDMPVIDYLTRCASGLTTFIDNTKEIVRLWEGVQHQVTGMIAVRDEVHNLQVHLEDLKVRFDQTSQGVLTGALSSEELPVQEINLSEELQHFKTAVEAFQGALTLRVPFVSQNRIGDTPNVGSAKRRFSVSGMLTLDVLQQATRSDLPFDPAVLNNAVRADLNSYSMMLSGGLKSLEQKADHLQLVKKAKVIDAAVMSIADNITHASESLAHIQDSLPQVEGQDTLPTLDRLGGLVRELHDTNGPQIARCLSPARELLQDLKSSCKHAEPGVQEGMVLARQKSLEDVEARFQEWTENAAMMGRRISDRITAEQDRLAAELRAREVKEKQEAEERARLEREAAEAEGARVLLEEQMRREAQEAEERARLEAEEQARLERQAAEAEELVRLQRQAAEAEEQARLEQERQQEIVAAKLEPEPAEEDESAEGDITLMPESVEEDVFGLRLAPSTKPVVVQESSRLPAQIFELRKRLRSLNLQDIAKPTARSGVSLPEDTYRVRLQESLSEIVTEVDGLRASLTEDTAGTVEFRSLESDVTEALESMLKIHRLADFSLALHSCDESLSDLLEHIDSYPAPPAAPISTLYLPNTSKPPEEQLSDRLSFIRELIEKMKSQSVAILDDSRVLSERERILQTWEELEAMGTDRVNGQKSRPPSAMSSGRSSRASQATASTSKHMKKASYTNLGSSNGRYLAPPLSTTRRNVSASSASSNHARSSSRMSVSSSRSVSGPGPSTSASSTLYGSTFASRQRTNSVASLTSSSFATPPVKRPPSTTSRPRAQTGARVASPAFSEASYSQSRSSLNLSRSSNRSSWARAPRQSFPSLPKSPPPRGQPTVKKPYIANPKNKLDVAVGDVINKLPVNINVEVVADTWKDQSGKYWIGDQEEPKLCFCRILRSQTVMVRVGGGWSELSKFIKEHFADAFRLLPESPPRMGTREEKWISSASLSQSILEETPSTPPRTPEPRGTPIPLVAVSTPGGSSPRSIKSPSSPGSPLRPLQFIRRADASSPSLRPETPVRKPRSSLVSALNTPATTRPPVWRP